VITAKRTRALAGGLAVSALGLMAASQLAAATHVRPQGASPFRASLVPAYKSCAAPNRTHGAPLAFPSCGPPVQSSNFLTVGTPDANGAGANSVGYIRIKVKTTSPEDLLISGTVSDVRCLPGTAAGVCGRANAADGPDYAGQLQSNATIRSSDHYNGPNLDEAATLQDIPFPLIFNCSSTADTTTGGVCTVDTYNPFPGPQWYEGERVVVEITQFEVFDGGQDGQSSTDDNTVFLREGIFIP
jgi:hypothetical protein